MKARTIRWAVISLSLLALGSVGVHRSYADPNDSTASQPDTPPPPDQKSAASQGGGAPSEGGQVNTPADNSNTNSNNGQSTSPCGCGSMGGSGSGSGGN